MDYPMEFRRRVFRLAFVTIALVGLASPVVGAEKLALAGLRSLSPVPGSDRVRPESNIILRLDHPIAVESAELHSAVKVVGTESGYHDGGIVVSSDDRTVLFKPDRIFAMGERVDVELAPPLISPGDQPFAFSFRVAARPSPRPTASMVAEWMADIVPSRASAPEPPIASPIDMSSDDDSLPPDLPVITSTVYQTPARGRLFLSNLSFGAPNVPYLLILDNSGAPVFYRRMPARCLDFKVQPNGRLTYFDWGVNRGYVMDDSYQVLGSFGCGNGYVADPHDFRLLPNGHAFLLSYDPQVVDMSQVVPGGDTAAVVTGLVIQEVDQLDNVYFQWRSWDHFQITDATHLDFTSPTIDYVHGNAIEIDADGNLLISSRHLDEITKIDRETGDVLWRWGGKNNQFTFIDDTLAFSYQHAIRRIANGHYTLFDNGNYHVPQFSRAVEYQLDQVNKTAWLVWQYHSDPRIFGGAMGYVQRLENGNTLIALGAGKPDVIEVMPDGTRVMEMALPTNVFTYRAYRQIRASDPPPPAVPGAPLLGELAPNPFRGHGVVKLNLEAPSMVSISVFDLAGREVSRILRAADYQAGLYTIPVDLSGQRPGLYLIRATVGSYSSTRKAMLLR
jgi:hypothetical protein